MARTSYTSLLQLQDRLQENYREIGLVVKLGLLALSFAVGIALVCSSVPYLFQLEDLQWALAEGSRCYYANINHANFGYENVCSSYKVWIACALIGVGVGAAHAIISLIVFIINFRFATNPPREDYGIKFYLYKDSFLIFLAYRLLMLLLFVNLLINVQYYKADVDIPEDIENIQYSAHVFKIVCVLDIGLASSTLFLSIVCKTIKYCCLSE